ncbi:MAG: SUMF1/EgtB/PvdO family nonheme iron enzyme [Alphaproteobacteria bacterium]
MPPPSRPPDWLGGLPRLYALLDTAGIPTEPGQRAAILHVTGKRQIGHWPGAPDIVLLLMPLLAQTPEARETVRAILRRWSDSLGTEQAPGRSAALPGAVQVAPVLSADAPSVAEQSAAVPVRSRLGVTPGRILLGALVIVLLALGIGYWTVGSRPVPSNPPAIPEIDRGPASKPVDPDGPDTASPSKPRPDSRAPVSGSVRVEMPADPMPLALRIALAAVPIVAFTGYLLWLMARRGRWLASGLGLARRAGPPLRLALDLDAVDALFPARALRPGSQSLKASLKVEGDRLDIGRTVDATAGAAGFFTPVNALVRVEPEYVFLIERLSPHDHAARLFDLAVERLRGKQHGVIIHRFFFQGDPETVYTDDPGLPPVMDIRRLSERFQRNRVFILGTADGFFHPLDDRPQPGTRMLLEWQKRAVLHARPVRHWGPTELRLLERGFALATATSQGLQRVAGYARLPERALARTLLEGRRTGPVRLAPDLVQAPVQAPQQHQDGTHRRFRDEALWVALSIFVQNIVKISMMALQPWSLVRRRSLRTLRHRLSILRHQWAESLWVVILALVVLLGTAYAWRDWIAEQWGSAIDSGDPDPRFVPGSVFRDPLSSGGEGPQMVVIPAGPFTMGSPPGEAGRNDDEGPQRRVTIARPFALGRYEVTWAEWAACVADGGCDNGPVEKAGGDNGWGKGTRPVINVSWDDAQAYVRWLNTQVEGEPYRLPTEAEWEYAARAGTTTRFSWGDQDPVCDEAAPNGANFTACTDNRTRPVGSFPANPFGLHDMHGNVWGWVQDCWHGNYNGAPTDGSARMAANGGDCSRRVRRGGSWGNFPQDLRSADRSWFNPSGRIYSVGFRVARTLSPPSP